VLSAQQFRKKEKAQIKLFKGQASRLPEKIQDSPIEDSQNKTD